MTRFALLAVSALAFADCKTPGDPPAGTRPALVEAAAVSASPATLRPALLEAPREGAVSAVVRDALSSTPSGRKLVVYVGASWCEPCRRFHEAVQNGELDAALANVSFLEFDLDRDRERLAADGYDSRYIPLFAVPQADGSPSPKRVEGAIKGDGAVGFILPRLRAMLAE